MWVLMRTHASTAAPFETATLRRWRQRTRYRILRNRDPSARGQCPSDEHGLINPTVGPDAQPRRGRAVAALLAAVLVLSAPGGLRAQRITGTVLEPDGATPAPFVVLVARDSAGAEIARTRTGDRGTFALAFTRAGQYAVDALRVGFSPTRTPLAPLAAGEERVVRIVLAGRPIALAAVRVRERATCGGLGAAAAPLVQAWQQARTALLSTAFRPDSATLVRTVDYTRVHEVWPRDSTWATIDSVRFTRGDAYRSVDAAQLARDGFVVARGDSIEFRAPDERVLLDDAFAGRHCFWLEPAPPEHPAWIGIGIRPAEPSPKRSDVKGVLWLAADGALEEFEYDYVALPDAIEKEHAGGKLQFTRLPRGDWIVSRWHLTMPQRVFERRGSGVRMELIPHLRRTVEQGGAVTSAQVAGAAPSPMLRRDVVLHPRAPQGAPTADGTLLWIDGDTAALPLGADGTARLRDREPGPLRVRMLSALARDLGVDPLSVDLAVLPDTGVLRFDLDLPTLGEIAGQRCPGGAAMRGAVAVGRVTRDAGPGAELRALRLVAEPFDRENAAVAMPSPEVRRDSAGRWWACDVPRTRAFALHWTSGDTTSTLVRFRIPSTLDLAIVGSLTPRLAIETGTSRWTAADPRAVIEVVDALDGAPLPYARVTVGDDDVRTDAAGRAAVHATSAGLQRVTIARIGYTPRDTAVAFAAPGGAVVTVRLAHIVSTLAEVRINGRVVRAPVKYADVLDRAAAGHGTFFTKDDLGGARDLKSLLAAVPGVQARDRGVSFSRCRGELGSALSVANAAAAVQVYIDGLLVVAGSNDEDPLTLAMRRVNPRDIEMVEVYNGVTRIPVEFLSNACAVIAIWTRSY